MPKALALEEPAEDKARLKACERKLCAIVNRSANAADLQCELAKTWAKKKIKENVEAKSLSWSVGDARCSATVKLAKVSMETALSTPKFGLQLEPTDVRCDVEQDGKVTHVTVTVAPKIVFRNGQAERAKVGVKRIDAPAAWSAALWTVAKVEDTLGLFQRDVLKEINKLVHQTCPANVEPSAPAGTAQK